MDAPLAAAPAPLASPLPSPQELCRSLPLPPSTARRVARTRQAIRDILHGRDAQRWLVIVGPCSLHDPTAALDYAARLERLQRELDDVLLLVMRTYVEKSRSALGWKGLANDPDLDGRCDVARGLRLARELLLQIGARDVACAAELLEPAVVPFLSDLLSWGAIGARTAESPIHRQLASGLGLPVGFKNTTDGRVQPALDAILSASRGHCFPGLGPTGRLAVLRTRGNPDAHLVLRGGCAGPNHDPLGVARSVRSLGRLGLRRGVLVDCSHGNSGKQPARQAQVCRDVRDQWRAGQGGLMGVKLESHLLPGRQEPSRPALLYGTSVTDACIGWAETETLLKELAASLGRKTRAAPGRGPSPGS